MNTDKDVEQEIAQIMEMAILELKLPLTSVAFNIQSMKRLLSDEEIPDTLEEKIDLIEAKANQMSSFLEHLLDLAKTQISEIQMRKNFTYTHTLLSEALLYFKKQSKYDFVQIENLNENQYCTVECDKDRLIQVFVSIVDNLLNFNPHSQKILMIAKINGEYAQFIIKDASYTIAESHMETLFDKFHYSLALSKWIIKAHQGRIWVESTSSEGTAFYIELPKKISMN